MQLMIRTRATARGRMLPRRRWRLKRVAQYLHCRFDRPHTMPISPPCSATAASFEALRQSRWLRTVDGFAVRASRV